MSKLLSWDRTICPSHWTGRAVALTDERVFVCGSCPNPEACAENDRCARMVENKRGQLPQRIALCPDCAPEFYYPLKDGEGLTCPVCPLEMTVYEKVGTVQPAVSPADERRWVSADDARGEDEAA